MAKPKSPAESKAKLEWDEKNDQIHFPGSLKCRKFWKRALAKARRRQKQQALKESQESKP